MADRTTRVWEHEDFVIVSVWQLLPADTVAASSALRIYFDGGCRKGLGTSGAAAFAPDGRLLWVEARYHGEAVPNNNQEEAQGLLLALQLASELASEKGVLVLGDSSLTIAFMQCQARPGK